MCKQKYTKVRVNEFASDRNMAMNDSHFDLSNVGEMPYQPVRHSFPKCRFGKTKVSSCAFQRLWFVKWKWLHYNSSRDLAFCYTCVSAIKIGKVRITTGNVLDSTLFF